MVNNPEIQEVTADTFDADIVKSKMPAVVDFWATWCGPCKAIAPSMAKLATEYKGRVKVAKVDIDKNQKVAQEYDIKSIPTLLFFKGGKVVGQLVGSVSKTKIGESIERMLKG